MSEFPLVVLGTGMITSVGLNAPASCAAIRAGVTNTSETRFVISSGESLRAHAVQLESPWRGIEKLARMAAMAIEECLAHVAREDWSRIPLLLCVAERTRPGRLEDLDELLMERIQGILETRFAAESLLVPHGRVGIALALNQARHLLYEGKAGVVLIAGTDSLLTWPTIRVLDSHFRLLSRENPNGFIPGESGCAVLIGPPAQAPQLRIDGIGFATETAHIDSQEPLRGEGLTCAIREALRDAVREMHDTDFRVADVSGESYYFKEAALALARSHRHRPDVLDIWHPAECIGETGSAIGPAMLAVVEAAFRKGYAPGPVVLLHAANDGGQRAAIVACSGEH